MNESYVPDSVPGPVRSSGASGNSVVDPSAAAISVASDQLLKPSDSEPISAHRSAKLRHSGALSLLALVMTVRPSDATCSSMYSIPFCSQMAISSSSMAREASEMSISPSQKSVNPSPVPGPSTAMLTSGFSPLKASAASDEIGSTVYEPEMLIDPETSPPPSGSEPESVPASAPASSSSPQAAAVRLKARMIDSHAS